MGMKVALKEYDNIIIIIMAKVNAPN